MITFDQAIQLKHGQRVHDIHYGGCTKIIEKRGAVTKHIREWRVNGKVKTWKTKPGKFQIPLKFGLYDYAYLTDDNAKYFHLPDDCPIN